MSSLPAKAERAWQVLLIGGASGTGKTHISYRLAQHFGTGITEVDDFQVILEKMTTPEQQPILHFWQTHHGGLDLPAETVVEQLISVGEAMRPALEAVVASHLESHSPVVLEGDFILPAFAALPAFERENNNGRVQGVFLIEPDEAQLRRNYLQREPENGEQTRRARVSYLYGQWLAQEARRCHLPAILARPWEDVFERVMATIG